MANLSAFTTGNIQHRVILVAQILTRTALMTRNVGAGTEATIPAFVRPSRRGGGTGLTDIFISQRLGVCRFLNAGKATGTAGSGPDPLGLRSRYVVRGSAAWPRAGELGRFGFGA